MEKGRIPLDREEQTSKETVQDRTWKKTENGDNTVNIHPQS